MSTQVKAGMEGTQKRTMSLRPLNSKNLVFGALFLAFVAALYVYVPSFFQMNNITQMLRQASIPGLIAIGVTFVVICGKLDLSVGSILSASAICSVVLYNSTGSVALAIAAPLALGLLVGFLNGWLVAYLNLNSLIVTLAMLSIVQGLALVYTGGADMVMRNPASTTGLGALGRGSIFAIPIPVVLAALFACGCGLILRFTSYGRRVFAVGGNDVASLYSSLNVRATVFFAYAISGLLSGMAGAVYASRVATARHDSGQGLELLVLAMVILGGTNLFGGAGSILRTVIGVLVIVFLQNLLLLMGLPFYIQWIGIAIILVVVAWINVRTQRQGLAP